MQRNDEETSRRANWAEFTPSIDDFTKADGDYGLTSARLRSKQNTREYPADSTKILQERSCHNLKHNLRQKKTNKKTQNK